MRRKAQAGAAVNPAVRWAGRVASLAGLAAWSTWLAWRVASAPVDAISALVLVLEVAALIVSLVLSAALWSFGSLPGHSRVTARSAPLVDVVGEMLGVADLATLPARGADDTGEVARARRGLQLLDPRSSRAIVGRPVAVTAWALVAVDGIRRMMFVALLVVVLLTGRFPFELPSATMLAAPAVAVMLFSVSHWMLSGGMLRPGVRLRWSMASVGAGLGDGISRSGLPIRWTATLATMIVLNLAVALRGVSDRWTHGLGAMPRDERVVAMLVAWWLVLVGFAALRILAKPSLGFYGATRRLEETSTRRLALGTTLAVALVGFAAGVLPGGLPA
jgi:hypothetical protein